MQSLRRYQWGQRFLLHANTMGWIATPLLATCFASEPLEKGTDTKGLSHLESLLGAESQGTPVDRSNALASSKESAAEAVHWQSGDLALKGSWKSVLELDQGSLDSDVVRYQSLRGGAPLGIEGHRKMAKWCKSHGLASRAHAHWFGVLDGNASDAEARSELGFEFVGNRWFSPQEMSTALAKSKLTAAALKQWMPKVRVWVLAIEGKDTKKRVNAIQQLKELKDPRAIAALDIAIGQVSSDAAIHLIQAICRFQTREACVSLAGIAVSDPSSEAGIAAIEALRAYPLEFYVPDLLDLMCTEYELKNQVVTRTNGDLVLQLMQMREMRNRYESAQIDKLLSVYNSQRESRIDTVRGENIFRLGSPNGVLRLRSTLIPVNNQVASSIAAEESKRLAAEAQASIEESNESIRMLQSNIATVLRRTTGAKMDDHPKSWWDWWDRYQESYLVGDKYLEKSYYEDESSIVYSPEEASIFVPTRHECLVLGTPIQTEAGLKSVEMIRVGDQIVAQDITSGELSLRPVLRTTVRPPAATRGIVLDNGETIRATLGHPWWVIGRGWVKAKDLKEGMSLRTTTGFALIEKLKDAEATETFNLVVEDDHTYFVGQSRVLSFDASEIIPTFQRVPGVPAEVLWQE